MGLLDMKKQIMKRAYFLLHCIRFLMISDQEQRLLLLFWNTWSIFHTKTFYLIASTNKIKQYFSPHFRWFIKFFKTSILVRMFIFAEKVASINKHSKWRKLNLLQLSILLSKFESVKIYWLSVKFDWFN